MREATGHQPHKSERSSSHALLLWASKQQLCDVSQKCHAGFTRYDKACIKILILRLQVKIVKESIQMSINVEQEFKPAECDNGSELKVIFCWNKVAKDVSRLLCENRRIDKQKPERKLAALFENPFPLKLI